MIIYKHKYIPDNTNKCSICNKYISATDISLANYELVQTKRKSKIWAHTDCIRKENKNGNRNRR